MKRFLSLLCVFVVSSNFSFGSLSQIQEYDQTVQKRWVLEPLDLTTEVSLSVKLSILQNIFFLLKPKDRIKSLKILKTLKNDWPRPLSEYLINPQKGYHCEKEFSSRVPGMTPLNFHSLLVEEGGSFSYQDFYRWLFWIDSPESYKYPCMVCLETGPCSSQNTLEGSLSDLFPSFDFEWSKGGKTDFTFLTLTKKG